MTNDHSTQQTGGLFTATANIRQHVMPGQGSFEASISMMPTMPTHAPAPQQAPQVPQSWTPDRPPAAYRGASGQNPFSPVGQGHANPVQQGFVQTNAANGKRTVSFEISRKKNDALKYSMPISTTTRCGKTDWSIKSVRNVLSGDQYWSLSKDTG